MISQEKYEAAQNIVWDYEDQLAKHKIKCDHNFIPSKTWVHRCSLCNEMQVEKTSVYEDKVLKDLLIKYKSRISELTDKRKSNKNGVEMFENTTQLSEILGFIIDLENILTKLNG